MNAPVPQAKYERSAPQSLMREIRIAYPYLHEKREKNSAGVLFVSKKTGLPNPRYSATLMFPKLAADASQCANYMFLWGLAQEAAKKLWPTSLDAAGNWLWPVGAQYAVKDGDVPFVSKPKPGVTPPSAEETAKKNAWRRGYWIVEVENFLDPGPRVAKIINGVEEELPAKTINGIVQYKGGDFGVVNIHAWSYENSTFGVNFGFDGFCFTREGEAIGNSGGPRSVAQMFTGVAGMAPPVGAAAPGAGGPPMLPQVPQQYAPPAPPAAPVYAAPPSPPAPPMPPGAMAPAGGPPMPPFPR